MWSRFVITHHSRYTRHSRIPTDRSLHYMAHKPIEKFGVQVEKARVITVYRNGDKHHDGVQVTMNMKKFKTYDQVRAPRSAPTRCSPLTRIVCS